MYLQSNIRCKHCSEIFFLSHYLFRLCTLFPSFYLSFFLINHYSLSLSFLLITSQSLFLSLFLSLCLSFLFITPLSLSFSAPLSLTPPPIVSLRRRVRFSSKTNERRNEVSDQFVEFVRTSCNALCRNRRPQKEQKFGSSILWQF